jgi:hypothetical protein
MELRPPAHRRGRKVGTVGAETVFDPDHRPVTLTPATWRHITNGHPELGRHRRDVLHAVRRPTLTIQGPRPDEVWFYLAEAGPSRWLKVVVRFQRSRGLVVTAFARRSAP